MKCGDTDADPLLCPGRRDCDEHGGATRRASRACWAAQRGRCHGTAGVLAALRCGASKHVAGGRGDRGDRPSGRAGPGAGHVDLPVRWVAPEGVCSRRARCSPSPGVGGGDCPVLRVSEAQFQFVVPLGVAPISATFGSSPFDWASFFQVPALGAKSSRVHWVAGAPLSAPLSMKVRPLAVTTCWLLARRFRPAECPGDRTGGSQTGLGLSGRAGGTRRCWRERRAPAGTVEARRRS